MLRELGNEIIELFEVGEVKDTQIAELRRENEELRGSVEPLNAQISKLQAELNVKIGEIANKDNAFSIALIGFNVNAIIQGILVAGATVLGNQLIKQYKKENE